jgi:hypothetical protein
LQIILREKFVHAGDPRMDDGFAAFLGTRGALQNFVGDAFAVFPDGAKLGGGRAAVRADENFLAHDLKG